jgi:uncharacterized protein
MKSLKSTRLCNTIFTKLASISLLLINTGCIILTSSDKNVRQFYQTYQGNGNSTPARMINIASGTGFFVSGDSIITNAHVVKGCSAIRIRGAVEPGYAQLSAIDTNTDLAILKTSHAPLMVAPLRGKTPLQVGEDVSVMGYPLDRALDGKYLYKKAVITNTDDVYGNMRRIQFTDSVEKGNSGGPLIDSSGTVIGVIVGKMNFYKVGSDISSSKPVKTSSVAITLDNLKRFLDHNKVSYRTDDTAYGFKDREVENIAKDYIVNIHCIKDGSENTESASTAVYPARAFN